MKNFILEIFKLYLEGIKMLVPLIVGFFSIFSNNYDNKILWKERWKWKERK